MKIVLFVLYKKLANRKEGILDQYKAKFSLFLFISTNVLNFAEHYIQKNMHMFFIKCAILVQVHYNFNLMIYQYIFHLDQIPPKLPEENNFIKYLSTIAFCTLMTDWTWIAKYRFTDIRKLVSAKFTCNDTFQSVKVVEVKLLATGKY